MLDNSKFIALAMQSSDSALETFKSFSVEEQNEFIDHLLYVIMIGVEAIKHLDPEERAHAFISALKLYTPEQLEVIGQMIELVPPPSD